MFICVLLLYRTYIATWRALIMLFYIFYIKKQVDIPINAVTATLIFSNKVF